MKQYEKVKFHRITDCKGNSGAWRWLHRAADICRELGISLVAFYKCKQRYWRHGSAGVKETQRIGRRTYTVQAFYANPSLMHEALKDAAAK